MDPNNKIKLISLWHPVGDKWVLFYQIKNIDGKIMYFTDGKEVDTTDLPNKSSFHFTIVKDDDVDSN
ncbi:hypothetical protein KKE60_08345 [Patescibacteria group bacterium]|nr:hypothetical protein [Patescibacteria group bacterium]